MEKEKTDSLATLFESMDKEVFTEELQLKMQVLFEDTVRLAVEQKEQELEESNKTEIAEFKDELVEQIDSYLDYFTQEYIKENEQPIESKAKVKLAEKVLGKFQELVEDFNLSLNEEDVDAEEEIEGLKEESSKLHNKLIESKKELDRCKKLLVIKDQTKNLTDMDAEKIEESVMSMDYKDAETFTSKVKIMVEQVTEPKKDQEKLVEDQEVIEEEKPSAVKQYLKYLK